MKLSRSNMSVQYLSLQRISSQCMSLQKGVTIIELLVSLLIASFVLAGVVQLYTTSSTNAITYEGAARIQENSRFAFSRIELDLTQAASSGCFNLIYANQKARFENILGVQSAAGERYDMSQFVLGLENTGTKDTDQLIVRYTDDSKRVGITRYTPGTDTMTVDTSDEGFNDLADFDVVYAGNCTRLSAFMITKVDGANLEFKADDPSTNKAKNLGQKNNQTGISLAEVISNDVNLLSPSASLSYVYSGDSFAEYRVANSTAGNCTAATPQNCALFRNGIELVEGVEDFQIEYGWQVVVPGVPGGAVQYGTWDDVNAAGAQLDVDRIQVTATFNSVQRSPTVEGDAFLSKTMSRVFMLRNQLPVN